MTLKEFCKNWPQHSEEVEERAAIMEYDGGMNRDEAERQAISQLKLKYQLYGKGYYGFE